MREKRQWPGPLRRAGVRMALAAAALTAAYTACFSASGQTGLYVTLIDGIFMVGLGFLVVGMSFYIHNIGLFKTFRYWAYRASARRAAKNGAAFDARPMDLVAFTQFIMSQPKKPAAAFLCFGGGLTALSYAMTILYGAL